MSGSRKHFIVFLTILTDSLWLFPVIGVFGLLTDQGGAPISWIGITAILLAGLITNRLFTATYGSGPMTYMALTVIGLGAIYFSVAAHILAATEGGWDFGWFVRLSQGDISGPEVISVLSALLCAAFLWRRAIQIADEPMADERLRNTFRTGTLALAVVLVIEFATETKLHASDCLIPFFLLSLGGLALIHRPTNPAMARSWTKIALATVTLIITGGFLFGLLGGQIGGAILTAAGIVWAYFLAAAAWILELLLGPILELFFSLIESLKPEGDSTVRPVVRPDIDWDKLDVTEAAPFVDAVISFLRFPLIALFIYLLISYLIRTHRHWNVLTRKSPIHITHETIERDGDAMRDIAHLLDTLLPSWMRRRAHAADWKYPRDLPGLSEIYQLYFGLLDSAAARGIVAAPSTTPSERVEALKSGFPGLPVHRLTRRFNAACFGRQTSDDATIQELRQAFEAPPTPPRKTTQSDPE